jgi:type VI secretion system secreted protein VgrG
MQEIEERNVMNPKSGKAGNPVAPAGPDVAQEADVADPGQVAKIKAEQIEKQEGKYGAASFEPHMPNDDDIEEKSWIEIELVDEEDNPVPGEKYRITLPNGKVAQGTLDHEGFARVEGIDPGTCQITFPELDKEAWEFIESTGPKQG